MTEQTTEPGTTLSQADATKVRLAFAKMPYTGGVHLGKVSNLGSLSGDGNGLTVEDVVEALDGLGEVLRTHAREHDAMESAYRALTSDVAAMRRVLGTDAL